MDVAENVLRLSLLVIGLVRHPRLAIPQRRGCPPHRWAKRRCSSSGYC